VMGLSGPFAQSASTRGRADRDGVSGAAGRGEMNTWSALRMERRESHRRVVPNYHLPSEVVLWETQSCDCFLLACVSGSMLRLLTSSVYFST
jgi:hypothetical protein